MDFAFLKDLYTNSNFSLDFFSLYNPHKHRGLKLFFYYLIFLFAMCIQIVHNDHI
jgi:hypothetical protein